MALSINGTTGISGVDGSNASPAIQGTDSNTGLSFGSDTVNINTGGTTRATVDSSGKFGIGNTSPASFDDYANLLVVGTTSGNNGITIAAGSSNSSSIYFADGTSGGSQKNAGIVDYNHSTDKMRFGTAASDAMVIDSSRKEVQQLLDL